METCSSVGCGNLTVGRDAYCEPCLCKKDGELMGAMKRFAEDISAALGRDLDNHGELDDDVLHVVRHFVDLHLYGLKVEVVDNIVVVSGVIEPPPRPDAGEFDEALDLPDPTTNEECLRKRADLEDQHPSVSVGGMAHDLGELHLPDPE